MSGEKLCRNHSTLTQRRSTHEHGTWEISASVAMAPNSVQNLKHDIREGRCSCSWVKEEIGSCGDEVTRHKRGLHGGQGVVFKQRNNLMTSEYNRSEKNWRS
jgi:hypothetical protein